MESVTKQPDHQPTAKPARRSRPKLPAVQPMAPILVDAAAAGALVGISRAQWLKMGSTGEIPAAVRLAERCVRWRVEELRAWCDAGCPSRDEWERIKAARARIVESN
jgi:predicted DNA-binding transcriptional regulator AlpA